MFWWLAEWLAEPQLSFDVADPRFPITYRENAERRMKTTAPGRALWTNPMTGIPGIAASLYTRLNPTCC